MGRENEIIPSLRNYVDHDSHNVELRLLLAAQCSKNSSDWDKAKEEYEALIREGPSVEAYRGLFDLFKQEGKVEEVLSRLDRAVAAARLRVIAPWSLYLRRLRLH